MLNDEIPKAEIRLFDSKVYADCNISIRRLTAAGDRVEVWCGPVGALVKTLEAAHRLCGYASTAKLHNHPSWMLGLEEQINILLECLNDSDRVRWVRALRSGWGKIIDDGFQVEKKADGSSPQPLDPAPPGMLK